MGYDPRSAAVIVLCIGAVLVAAVLFPVAGMDGGPTSGDADVSERPASDGSSTDDGPPSGETNDEPGDNADTGSEGEESGSETDGSDEQGADGTGSGTDDERSDDEASSETPDGVGETFDLVGIALASILLVGAAYALRSRVTMDSNRRSNGRTLPLPDGPLPRLRMHLARIPELSMVATIALARRTTAAGSGLAALGRSVVAAGGNGGRGIRLALRSVATISIGLPSIPRPRFPSIGWTRSDDGEADDRYRTRSASPNGGRPAATECEGYTEPDTVEEAWRRLVSSLALHRPSVRTPRECAAIAIDAGLPREAVETMTGAFEAVRYGDAARTPARLERVRAAYERVRESGGDGQ